MKNATRSEQTYSSIEISQNTLNSPLFFLLILSISLFAIFYSLDIFTLFTRIAYAMGITDLKVMHSAVVALLFVFAFLIYRYRSLTKILKERDYENLQLIRTLSESKQKYKVLLESIPDAVIVISYDWKILITNDDACQLFVKTSKEELIGANLLERFPGFIETNIYRGIQTVMKNGTTDVIVESHSYDGVHTRWFEVHIYPVSEGIMLINIDITERILAETALSESEYKYRQLFNGAYDGICIIELIDDQDLVFKEVNDYLCKLLGYSRDELLKISPFLLSPDPDLVYTAMHEVIRQGFTTFEVPLIQKNNHLIPVEIHGHLYMLHGKKYVLTITRDLSERKQVEAALLESEQRYRSLVDLSPDMITIEQDYKIVFANPAAASMLGVSAIDDLLGKSPGTFLTVADAHRDKLIKQFYKIFDGDACPSFEEFEFIRHDQAVLDIELASIPFIFNDKPAIQNICRDISARKKAEEERKKAAINLKLLQEAKEYDRLKTEFFSNISHEFKTPLNVILGTLQLCDLYFKNIEITPELMPIIRYKKILKQNCYRLLRLINNLLDITKIDSGYFQIQPCNCDMVSLLEEITLSVADYVQNKELAITFDSTIEQKNVACDPDKIERILLNLLSNAIKFTNPGGRISVSFFDYGTSVEIVVKDTGIGIPEEKQSIIFERFRQVDPLLTRNHEGSGIGLALVKSLVELHQGTISLQSEVEKGSTFTIKLPVVLLEDDPLDYEQNENLYNVEKLHVEFSDIYDIEQSCLTAIL